MSKKTQEPETAEELADNLNKYDAETAQLVAEAEAFCTQLEAIYAEKKGEATDAKKRYQEQVANLRALIHDREKDRGQPRLFQ